MRDKSAFLAKLHQGLDGLLSSVKAGRFGCFWGILIRFGLFFCFTGHLVAHVPVRLGTQPEVLAPALLHKIHSSGDVAIAVGGGPLLSIFWGPGL